MNNLTKIILAVVFLLTFLNGCTKKNLEIENISQMRSLLPKLTGKVKAGILEGISSEKELNSFINDEFPEIIVKFSEYSIFMKNENNTAVVLICNKEADIALLEDASCTGSIEGSELYTRKLPCEFQLDINLVCK